VRLQPNIEITPDTKHKFIVLCLPVPNGDYDDFNDLWLRAEQEAKPKSYKLKSEFILTAAPTSDSANVGAAYGDRNLNEAYFPGPSGVKREMFSDEEAYEKSSLKRQESILSGPKTTEADKVKPIQKTDLANEPRYPRIMPISDSESFSGKQTGKAADRPQQTAHVKRFEQEQSRYESRKQESDDPRIQAFLDARPLGNQPSPARGHPTQTEDIRTYTHAEEMAWLNEKVNAMALERRLPTVEVIVGLACLLLGMFIGKYIL